MSETKNLGKEPAFPTPNLSEQEESMLNQGLLKFGMSKR